MVTRMSSWFGNVIHCSPGARTVLIHADHKRRDAAASLLIGYYLRDLGYNVVVGNRFLSKMWYYLLRPEVVLTTHPEIPFFSADEFAQEARHCRFVLMHPESSGMIRRAMLAHMRGGQNVGDAFAKHYSKVLTWGPLLKEWVVDEGIYPDAIVEVVGCVRYDFYRSLRRPPREEQTLGGMPSFTGVSNLVHTNVFEHIHRNRDQHGIHYGRKGGFEDLLWVSAAYVRLFLEFLDVWCLDLKNPIHFRPYTLEYLEDYVFFRKRYGDYFHVDVHNPFPEWLARRCASVFCYSSSVIESIVSGIPYVTLQSVIEDRLEYIQPKAELPETRGEIYDYTHRPQSIEETVELATRARAGKLGLAVPYEESPRLQKLLWDYYGWPQPRPSSQLVAEAIHRLMQETTANHSNTRWRLLKDLVKTPWRVWVYSGRGRAWKTFDDYHFMPWHTGEKAYAYQAWRALCENR